MKTSSEAVSRRQRCRRLEYQRQYQGRRRLRVNNLSNITLSNEGPLSQETPQQREHRLQRLRENSATRFQNRNDEQRQHQLQRKRQNNAVRIHESNEEREQRLRVLGQNDAVRRNARRQELHDLQDSQKEYLLNAWQTAEQPLHQQQWVQNEMDKIHS